MTSRIWVTGALGMLGKEVMAVLGRRGIAAIGTDRELDITDFDAVERFAAREPFSTVINCAAFTGVDLCETQEAEAFAVNATGAGHIARAARARGAVAVHVSTDYVFDGKAHVPYVETDPTGPINAYGRTKLAGEQKFLAEGSDVGAYVVRTSWLFGAGGNNFVATMLRLFAERPEVKVVDDQTGRPTYAPDLAVALVEVAVRKPVPGIYHFANVGQTTWYGLAAAARTEAIARGREAGAQLTKIATADYPTPAKRPAWSVLATDKLQRAIELRPRPWREALGDYFEAISRGTGS